MDGAVVVGLDGAHSSATAESERVLLQQPMGRQNDLDREHVLSERAEGNTRVQCPKLASQAGVSPRRVRTGNFFSRIQVTCVPTV
jgi:hypothetical protein